MYFFIIMFVSRINVMINKYISYIIILQLWNTAARKHPTERENIPNCKKKKKVEGHWSVVYAPTCFGLDWSSSGRSLTQRNYHFDVGAYRTQMCIIT